MLGLEPLKQLTLLFVLLSIAIVSVHPGRNGSQTDPPLVSDCCRTGQASDRAGNSKTQCNHDECEMCRATYNTNCSSEGVLGFNATHVCCQLGCPTVFNSSACESAAIMHCRRNNNEAINCARRCLNKGNCGKFIQGIVDGNLTAENVDAAILTIGMFSRRRANRVPLPLEMRLESVEMLHSALRRQQRQAIRIFQRGGQQREDLLQVLDELLDDSEQDEWRTLQEASYSQNLLQSIEDATELIASATNSSRQRERTLFHFSGNNLVMDVECAPQNANFLHQLSPNASGFMSVAAVGFQGDSSKNEEEECSAVVSAVVARNLEEYINQNASNDSSGIEPNTHLVTLQVSMEITKPVQLFFTPINMLNETTYQCVFWDFSDGSWSSENLTTEFNGTHYICNSTHLTTFAVLVDVTPSDDLGDSQFGNNGSFNTKFNELEEFALQIVSYIGCGVSIFCLCLTILLLVLLRKSLNKGVLLYVHLNLAVALLIALVIFVAGIETAKSTDWLCKTVAALLHYFFLCVFCWMLAEGIILYLMLVRVFGTASEKWYYLLILGWGVPVPIVAITVGITHEYYNAASYCWLSVGKGVIWAFAGPVIFIILVNTILLLVTVVSIIRVKRKATGKHTRINTVMTALKGTIILLPLLGLTWIFGFLTINSNTTVFAWLFTIFNSLQGCFIFILHVARNDKVIAELNKLQKCFLNRKVKAIPKEVTNSTAYTE